VTRNRLEFKAIGAIFAGASIVGVAGLAATASGCRGATQITLHLSTDLNCSDPSAWQGVAVYVGSPGADVETKAATLTTSACNAGGVIGTVVVTPSGADDDDVGIRVVAGVTTKPEACAASDYAGCIVSRRTIRFTPHTSLDVDIALDGTCVGISCDAYHSCALGSCVEATVGNTQPADAGIVGPTVRCGDNGARCATTGDVCCLTVDIEAGTTTGQCEPSTECPPTSAVLRCDKESDCDYLAADGGLGGICALSFTNAPAANGFQPNFVSLSQCLSRDVVLPPDASFAFGLELCDDRQACLGGQFQCISSTGDPANPLPGYYWCDLQK
jgi:hypothetical protein